MSKLALAQILWPPVPSVIFVSLFDWVTAFGSVTVTATAFFIYVYAVFAPALIEVFLVNSRGAK